MNPASAPTTTETKTVPSFGCSRYAPAMFLPGATRFSEDRELTDPVQVVRLLRRFPQITRKLKAATEPEYRGGRRRMRGEWSLVFLAFMLSGLADMDRFWARYASSGIWKAAGFAERPSGPTLYLRFVELEQYREAFEQAARDLIRQARRHEPQIGRAVHVDGTGISTHATLEHFCPPGTGCEKPERASREPRVGDDLVGDIRAKDADTPENELAATPSTSLEWLEPSEIKRLGLDAYTWGKKRQFGWYRQNGHYYRSRDATASPRKYGGDGRKTRFWNGWNDITVTDAFTNAPLAIEIAAAREQEWTLYPAAMTRVHQAMGLWPQIASTDRGFVTKATYEFNTRRGIGSVFPWREPVSGVRRRHLEAEDFDRHGIPRCEHCGGPGQIRGRGLGFYLDGPKKEPRIRFRCIIRGDEKRCAGTQSIHCSREWRLLQPLALTDEVYHQLGHGHPSTERVHLHVRSRYTQGGKETVLRNKRLGIECQRLRAAALIFLEWFRLCLRHGWLGSHRTRNNATPALRRAGQRLRKVLDARRRWAIDLPYGEAARKVGLGRHGPPGAESPKRGKRGKRKRA